MSIVELGVSKPCRTRRLGCQLEHRAAEKRTLDRPLSAKRSSERDRLTSPAPAPRR